MTKDIQAWLAPVIVGLTLVIVLIKIWAKKRSRRSGSCGCHRCDLPSLPPGMKKP